MGINTVKGFISSDDVSVIQEYIKTITFNTKENHVPLHDNLYSEYNANFDIHTRGEMPKNILDIFSKYSKGLYDLVQLEEKGKYLPPMFSKHYIARYTDGKSVLPQTDPTKPERTYRSLIFWNNNFDGGELFFSNLGYSLSLDPGDLVYFIECEENKVGINKISNGDLYLSEAWMGHEGQLWMPNSVPYEEVEWDNWEIKGF